LNEQFLVCRDIYNICLQRAIDEWESNRITLRRTQFSKIVTEMRLVDPRFTIPYAETLRKTSDQLTWAFDKFFERQKKKMDGANISPGYPRFKKSLKSIRFPDNGFKLLDAKHIELRRIGKMPIILHRLPKGEVRELIILRKPGGKWFIIFTLKANDEPTSNHGPAVGIDIGLNSYLTLSDGTQIDNPEFFRKSEKKIKKLQKEVSRKEKGSNNRYKAKRKLAIASEKVKNQRNDFLHKLTSDLVSNYGLFVVESLTISNMIKNHKLAKSISDASWSRFIDLLRYKAESAGTEVLTVPEFEPTTKRCSQCGNVRDISLSERMYSCPACGLFIDRDKNAAINILNCRAEGARIHACGEMTATPLKLEVHVDSLSQELYAWDLHWCNNNATYAGSGQECPVDPTQFAHHISPDQHR
jgi:putative transposase